MVLDCAAGEPRPLQLGLARRVPTTVDDVEASGDGHQHEDDNGCDDEESANRAEPEHMHRVTVRSVAIEIKGEGSRNRYRFRLEEVKTMGRGRRFQGPPGAPQDEGSVTKQRPRRAVVDNMRRKIERALAVADAAEDLAKAAQAVLIVAGTEQIGLNRMGLSALRDALTKYREVHGD